MDGYYSADEEEDYDYSSDQQSFDGIDNEESDLQPTSSKKSSTQVLLHTLLPSPRSSLSSVVTRHSFDLVVLFPICCFYLLPDFFLIKISSFL